MENNKENLQEQSQEFKPKGWSDIVIDDNLPVKALIDFFNVLNQRLCTLENIVTLPDEKGEHHSITEIYAKQEQLAQAQNTDKE